jgi:hypothetical protein
VALVSGEDKDAWGMARQIILHQMNVPDSGLVELIGLAGTTSGQERQSALSRSRDP